MRDLLLTEDDVVDAMAAHLTADGWTIIRALRTTEQGVDLEAVRGDERLLLEAKGGRSLNSRSARFGDNFTTVQQRDHVAKAVAVACALRSRDPGASVAIALPDTPTHRRRVEAVRYALGLLRVSAYVVHPDRRVEQLA
jgi:hypothetical protein